MNYQEAEKLWEDDIWKEIETEYDENDEAGKQLAFENKLLVRIAINNAGGPEKYAEQLAEQKRIWNSKEAKEKRETESKLWSERTKTRNDLDKKK